MKIDKKRELYQHYQKLQSEYDNKTIVFGIYKLLYGVMFLVTFCSGIFSIPFIRNLGWFYQGNFEKLVCQLDSVGITKSSYGKNSYFLSLTRNRDMELPLEKRKKRVVHRQGDPFYLYKYLNKTRDTLPYEQSPILDSIPLWVNKNTGKAYLIQKHSPDKIDFWAIDHTIFLLAFIFSLPIVVFFCKFINKNNEKEKYLENDIKKAYEEWENYSSYK